MKNRENNFIICSDKNSFYMIGLKLIDLTKNEEEILMDCPNCMNSFIFNEKTNLVGILFSEKFSQNSKNIFIGYGKDII